LCNANDRLSRRVYRSFLTVAASAAAAARVWAAIAETNQQPDGSVKVPEALASLMGCDFTKNSDFLSASERSSSKRRLLL